MTNLWNVSDARARFSALLDAARTAGPQVIRQSGLPDVTVDRDRGWVPMSYLADALARCDGMDIALAQYYLRRDGYGDNLVAEKHLPPNLSGDVLGWVLEEKGVVEAASYVISATVSMRELQQVLGIPLSSVAQVIMGLRLTAGQIPVFTAESIHWIESLAEKQWGSEAKEVLGADWAERSERVISYEKQR